jgi:uncharacterized protein YoxC
MVLDVGSTQLRRRGGNDNFEPLLGPAAPVALLVTDPAGQIVYRNKAALDQLARVKSERGDAAIFALRRELAAALLACKSFPSCKTIHVTGAGGEHAAFDFTYDRFGERFVATWCDVTDREDERRFLAEMHKDLISTTAKLTGLGEQLAGGTAELSQRAGTVASAATEMSASINEIGRSADEAAKSTAAVVAVAQKVADRIGELTGSSAEIGAISQLITSIAQQTNLLALNATIEAARAGEAGRGFAVVANEVKDLAGDTSRATNDIAPKIAKIQAVSTAVAEAIDEIVSSVQGIEAQQATIASAVEQQSLTTSEMSAEISSIAASTQSVSDVVERLGGTAGDVSAKVDQVAARL